MEHVRILIAEKEENGYQGEKSLGTRTDIKVFRNTCMYNRLNLNGELKQNYTELPLTIVSLQRHKNWTPKIASPWRLPRRKDKSNV